LDSSLFEARDLVQQTNISKEDQIVLFRELGGTTSRDKKIEEQQIPQKPIWLYVFVNLIRFYQLNISKKLGNRCVYDPSCSHYAEAAFRKKGLLTGMKLTIKRLKSCRPNNGGINEVF